MSDVIVRVGDIGGLIAVDTAVVGDLARLMHSTRAQALRLGTFLNETKPIKLLHRDGESKPSEPIVLRLGNYLSGGAPNGVCPRAFEQHQIAWHLLWPGMVSRCCDCHPGGTAEAGPCATAATGSEVTGSETPPEAAAPEVVAPEAGAPEPAAPEAAASEVVAATQPPPS